jgi:hypothetical protein
MIKMFTQNDLVDYVYQENNNKATDVAIEESEQLQILNNEFSSMKQMLNTLEIKPPQRSIDVILAYAKQQKQS